MELKSLAELVLKVRTSQKAFFRSRKPSDLQQSKAYEAELDKAVNEILNNAEKIQPKLF